MEKLEKWFDEQFAERKVEPNSGLGQAITYMQKRWDGLTLFLRQAGVPLDSNMVERILKRAVLITAHQIQLSGVILNQTGDDCVNR